MSEPQMTTPPVHRYVGRIIHVMRKQRGMRQSELASLTGLKQPNLSRIENGLVVPRPSTLQKVAMALDCDVKDLLSEDRAREVEMKWGAMLSPKNAGQLFAGKLSAVPLFSSTSGYDSAFDSAGQPAGKMELLLQLLPIPGQSFALKVADDSMQVSGGEGASFAQGEILVFADKPAVKSGDFALVRARPVTTFRKVDFEDGERVRLTALNPSFGDQYIAKKDVLRLWKLVRHVREY